MHSPAFVRGLRALDSACRLMMWIPSMVAIWILEISADKILASKIALKYKLGNEDEFGSSYNKLKNNSSTMYQATPQIQQTNFYQPEKYEQQTLNQGFIPQIHNLPQAHNFSQMSVPIQNNYNQNLFCNQSINF